MLAGCTAQASADTGAQTVLVSVDRCGSGWTAPTAGLTHFTLRNVDTRSGEVYLTDAASGAVYAEVDPIGAGTTAPLTVELGGGSYAFRCAMEDEAPVVGPTVRIDGAPLASPTPVQAVSQADLIQATQQYEAYVKGRIPALRQLTATLRADIDRGDLVRARADWLPAHLEYERLGAAYGAFGDLDGEINGTPTGSPDGVSDPEWTGFHRVEYGLWHGQSAAALRPAADALGEAVDGLTAEFADAQIDPLDVSIRAHEITENALQFELTGKTDFGSGSNLATIGANLDGTAAVLGILHPLLTSRYPQLDATTALLAKTRRDVTAGGSLAALRTPQRELLDADLSQLSEDLAPIASILEPRRVQQ
jgi:iron uptake system component EfeO